MASGKGYQETGGSRASSDGNGEYPNSKAVQDSNRVRREQYRTDAGYREQAKKRSRESYRKAFPRAPEERKVSKVEPKTKEVTTEGLDHPLFLEVFTIPDLAKYLGKTPLTVKRWISDKLLPPPVLQCTSYGYAHYSLGEAKIVASVLKDHEKEYDYLHHTHVTTINRLWQNLEAFRKSHV